MSSEILGFSGEYRFLSNFYLIDIEISGITFKSSEHYYMYEKTTDENLRKKILEASTGAIAKKIGKTIRLRTDWEEKYKNQSMIFGLKKKFSLPEMRDKLLSTGDAYIEETNTWGDVYWGVFHGTGKNMLGRMLMYLRGKLHV